MTACCASAWPTSASCHDRSTLTAQLTVHIDDQTTPAAAASVVTYDRLTSAMALSYVQLSFALGVSATLPSLREQFGLSATVASLHGGFFGWGLLVTATFSKQLAHLGAKRVFTAAVALTTCSVIVFSTGPSVEFTLLGALGIGLGGAAVVVVVPGVLAAHHGQRFGAVFAAVNAWPALVGMVASGLIGVGLATPVGWRPAYLIPGVLAGLAVIATVRHASFPRVTAEPATPWALFGRPRFRAVWALLVIGVVTEFCLVIWGATYLREVAGVSKSWAPPLSGFYAFGVLTGRFAVPQLLNRISAARATQLGFVVAGIGGFLLWGVDVLAVRIVALVIIGLGVAPIYPLTVDLLFATAPNEQARLSAAAALASGLAISIGPLVLGVVADNVGLRSAILVVPIATVIGLLGATLVGRRAPGTAVTR